MTNEPSVIGNQIEEVIPKGAVRDIDKSNGHEERAIEWTLQEIRKEYDTLRDWDDDKLAEEIEHHARYLAEEKYEW